MFRSNIIDFDRVISNSTYGQLGALKFTREKYYRITGKSTQLEGVKSDVVAPDMYKYIDVGEKDEENPLIWDQINPTKHNKWSGYENYAILQLFVGIVTYCTMHKSKK